MEDEFKNIQNVLDRQIQPDDLNAVESKLMDCINLLGVSAKLKADAHKKVFKAREAIMKTNENEKTARLKLIIDNETAEEQSQYLLAERLNVSLSKAIDGLKSVLNINREENLKW